MRAANIYTPQTHTTMELRLHQAFYGSGGVAWLACNASDVPHTIKATGFNKFRENGMAFKPKLAPRESIQDYFDRTALDATVSHSEFSETIYILDAHFRSLEDDVSISAAVRCGAGYVIDLFDTSCMQANAAAIARLQ